MPKLPKTFSNKVLAVAITAALVVGVIIGALMASNHPCPETGSAPETQSSRDAETAKA